MVANSAHNEIKLFENKQIRFIWNTARENGSFLIIQQEDK